MKFSTSVLLDLNFNLVLEECAKFVHSKKSRELVYTLFPSSNLNEITQKQQKTDCMLSALQKGESIPLEIFPEITEIFASLQIENNPLNENMFRDLFLLLDISLNLQSYLKKDNFYPLQEESNSLYINTSGQKKIKNIFNDAWQVSQ